MRNSVRRLGEKLNEALRNEIASKLNVVEVVSKGEGDCNIIPGGVPSESFPVIVVYSVNGILPTKIRSNKSPKICLNQLIKHLYRRHDQFTETKQIKIVLDQINTEITTKLLEIAQLANRLKSDLQIDLILGSEMYPVPFEGYFLERIRSRSQDFI